MCGTKVLTMVYYNNLFIVVHVTRQAYIFILFVLVLSIIVSSENFFCPEQELDLVTNLTQLHIVILSIFV